MKFYRHNNKIISLDGVSSVDLIKTERSAIRGGMRTIVTDCSVNVHYFNDTINVFSFKEDHVKEAETVFNEIEKALNK